MECAGAAWPRKKIRSQSVLRDFGRPAKLGRLLQSFGYFTELSDFFTALDKPILALWRTSGAEALRHLKCLNERFKHPLTISA